MLVLLSEELEGDVRAWEDKWRQADAAGAAVQAKLQQSLDDHALTQQKLSDAVNSAGALETQLKELRGRFEQVTATLQQRDKELKSAQAQHADLQQQLAAAGSRANEINRA